MNSLKLLGLALIACSLGSCDQARALAAKARKGNATAASDPELGAKVDRTAEGLLFRKDLPFPAMLEVRTTHEVEFLDARVSQSSALGPQTARISGTKSLTSLYERQGGHVRLTLEKAGFSTPELKDSAGKAAQPSAAPPNSEAAPPVPAARLIGQPIIFRQQAAQWKPEPESDFTKAAWTRDLTPEFPGLLIEAGAAPRPFWFGKRRLNPGDEIPLSGPALAMLFDADSTGEVSLVLQDVKNDPNGHPCGVFSITGNVSQRGVPSTDGNVSDVDITIESGEVWLSLIHPLVLREDLETIQTLVIGGNTAAATRIQGAMRVKTTRDWKVVTTS